MTLTERRIRSWAYDNAFTVAFLCVMFHITWVLLIVVVWWFNR